MTGTRCTVAVCKNSLAATRRDISKKVLYHTFPKDVSIRQQWIQRCKRAGKWNPDSCRVCSEHFLPEDYVRDLQAELMGCPRRVILKTGAIPSLHLTPKSKVSASEEPLAVVGVISKRTERQEKRARKVLVRDTLQQDSEDNSSQSNGNNNFIVTNIEEINFTIKRLEEENKCLKKSNLCFKKKLIETEKALSGCKQYLALKSGKLRQLRTDLKNIRSRMMKGTEVHLKAIEILKNIFTENQIQLICSKKKVVNWTPEEMSMAFTLRYLSKRTYIYLRKQLKFPLPGISTLQRFASKLERHTSIGLLHYVMTFLKVSAVAMTEIEKLSVIQFDEMKVKSLYEYDVQRDQVIGPHQQLQIVMIRGLIGNWKQPVYAAFDQKISKCILDDIITQLHEIGYRVIACVSDMGGGNVGLWREFGVSYNKNWFPHPCNENNKIYCFADAPHLLKLIRN